MLRKRTGGGPPYSAIPKSCPTRPSWSEVEWLVVFVHCTRPDIGVSRERDTERSEQLRDRCQEASLHLLASRGLQSLTDCRHDQPQFLDAGVCLCPGQETGTPKEPAGRHGHQDVETPVRPVRHAADHRSHRPLSRHGVVPAGLASYSPNPNSRGSLWLRRASGCPRVRLPTRRRGFSLTSTSGSLREKPTPACFFECDGG